MNYSQFGLFIVYALSSLVCGMAVYAFLKAKVFEFNRSVFLGEALLIGSIVIYGQLMFLSLIYLYKGFFLWGAVSANFLLLFNSDTRKTIKKFFSKKLSWDVPLVIFCLLVLFFIFRNCFFLYDVDSHSTYLYSQKLWLAQGTSFVGDMATDIRVFNPQFDAVPYSLGLSIYPQETLFPEFINLYWRLIALLVIFGYTAYRFNRIYALGAGLFMLFNDHFYYSGVYNCVVINAAIIAFVFIAAYSLWECRMKNDPFRFLIAMLCLSQIITNKYQMLYVMVFMFLFGLFIQVNILNIFKRIFSDKKYVIVLLGTIVITSLFFIRNWIQTGIPMFPIMAGKFQVLNWSPEMGEVFLKLARGVSFQKFVKYMNYLFVWPGVNPAKYVISTISFLPLILIFLALRNRLKTNDFIEFCYWLCLSLLLVLGLCLACHQDPRYYRYILGVQAFSAVFSIHFILYNCFNLKNKIIAGIIIVILSIPGYRIMTLQGYRGAHPYYEDNLNVILNKVHTKDFYDRFFPANVIAREGFEKNKDKAMRGAWDKGVAGRTDISAFLLPIRPQVGMWLTSVVRWESYDKEELIIQDLEEYGIDWVMRVKEKKLIFLSKEEYAKEAVTYDKYPDTTLFNYKFPRELSVVHY